MKKFADVDLPSAYDKLSEDQKAILQRWIDDNIAKVKTINDGCTSYGLKHFFEASEGGFYITNGMFKGAMLAAGFYTNNEDDLNWNFNVSRKSVKELYKWLNSR